MLTWRASLVDALAGTLDERFPRCSRAAWCVTPVGPRKRGSRASRAVPTLASRRWYRGSDPDDPAVAKHQVECFGSLGTRQFAIDGPHGRGRAARGDQHYRFVGGASPATVPRATLPVLPRRPTHSPAIGSTRSPGPRDGGASRSAAERGPGERDARILRTRRRDRDRHRHPRYDDGRRAGAPPEREGAQRAPGRRAARAPFTTRRGCEPTAT